MAELRVGVVGVGHLGKHHARIYGELPGVKLVGIADSDERTAEKISSKLGVRAFTDFRRLLPEVDALSLATPTPTHYALAREILSAGKHLLVEKPITESPEEAQELVRLAQEKNLILQVGHVERFNPAIRALEKVLTDPRFIESHRLAPFQPRGTDVGVVLDLMIHDIDIILHLVKSPIAQIQALGIDVLTPREDIANVRLTFQNGCVANLTVSRVSYKEMRKIRIFQPDCYLSLDYKNQDGVIYRRVNGKIIQDSIPLEKEEPLKLELQSFVECAVNRRAPVVSGEQAKRALDVGMEIVRQIREARKAAPAGFPA